MLKVPLKAADPVKIKVNVEGVQTINLRAYSALNDIFRKIDLQLDGILTSNELNLFGKIINDKFFQELTPESFKTEQFKGISCTEDGVSSHYDDLFISSLYTIYQIFYSLQDSE